MVPTHAFGKYSIKRRLIFFYLFGCAVTAGVCAASNPLLAGAAGWLYPALLLATYPAMYLMPAIALSVLAATMLPNRPALTAGISIVALSAIIVLLQGDLSLYALYGFHFNAFVWNLVSTPGGMASLGFDQISVGSLTLILVLLLVTLSGLWYLAGICARRIAAKTYWLLTPLLLLTLSERSLYAVSHFFANGPVLELAASMPLYQPATAAGLMERLGYVRRHHDTVKFSTLDGNEFHYPLTPLVARQDLEPPNIIMLVVESLRADMLTPEIMPKLWAFSTHAQRFTRHYSGGNGTRQGMFSLFYGLYGNSWDHFLYQRRPPVLFSVLDQHHYQRLAITSASFSYPEFDQTLFANFKPEDMIEDSDGASWGRDVRNVDRLLASLAAAQKHRPQLRFIVF
jgi:membrane-anchored protein YejM (alkaline phosphatase superfamily)